MMASGKTTVGKLVSKRLDLNFIDVDQYIENELKMKISKIFLTKGEAFFRKLEEKNTLNLLKKNKIVLSLGGGGFLNKNIREEILKNHLSFWLNSSSEILINRIRNNSKRPVAAKLTKNEILDLIKKDLIFIQKQDIRLTVII